MSRIGSWIRGSAKPTTSQASESQSAEDERQNLAEAMSAATLIMNDDVDEADRQLMLKDSAFHLLGRGLTQLMRSLLSFEQDIMRSAAERLSASENQAWIEMKRAQKETTHPPSIYSPGSVYALCYAESQLMSAVVAVLNESLTESIKGFYKLRKAFTTLDGLIAEEDKYIQSKRSNGRSKISLKPLSSEKVMPGAFANFTTPSNNASDVALDGLKNKIVTPNADSKDDNEDDDLVFVDADESHSGVQTPLNYRGHLANGDGKILPNDDLARETGEQEISRTSEQGDASREETESNLFADPVDAFTHSGANLCYGLLLLIISLVPPAFSKLLSIIGFRGDREKGLTLLWRSSKIPNINGAVAGLALLGFYNGLTGFCDILPDNTDYPDDVLGYPRERCELLLQEMRRRYPESRLLKLEEARMQSSKGNLDQAIQTLSGNLDSKMKQIKAFTLFEKSLNCMYAHQYLESAKSFEACMELNTWSHCLYTYIIACCQIELYRDARASKNVTEAAKWKEIATASLEDAPAHAGKKKFMSKQLPFDSFVVRKITKWQERAKAWSCDIIDAVGISPIEEIIYLWNGTKRMPPQQLEQSLQRLELSQATFPEKVEDNLDERGMRTLLTATVTRNQGKFTEAKAIIEEGILSHDRNEFRGHLYDDWSCPAAHYEMAVIAWLESTVPGLDKAAKIAECEDWLAKVTKWDGYVLDSRIGLRVTTANDTIKRYWERVHMA